LGPVQEALDKRCSDRSLEMFLVTDGEIWDQETLFNLLNVRIQMKKEPVRVFTLGVGDDVSHALIEGVARAGNGFSQTVGDNEKLDAKVVRMLKAALFPHIKDYRLEIKYEKDAADDLEFVEKVSISFKEMAVSQKKADEAPKKPISLFNTSENNDVPINQNDTSSIPKAAVPQMLQAPQNVPQLYPFSRTSVYLLMSPDTCQRKPISVILRGTCEQGPLELEIPVSILETPGETIHQLAAKKAVLELEEGRGWLQEAKTEDGTLVKDKHPSYFSDIVRLETVRLGTTFQVGGKNCSFVAVEKKQADDSSIAEDFEFLDDFDQTQLGTPEEPKSKSEDITTGGYAVPVVDSRLSSKALVEPASKSKKKSAFGGMFSRSAPQQKQAPSSLGSSAPKSGGGGLFSVLGRKRESAKHAPPMPMAAPGSAIAPRSYSSADTGAYGAAALCAVPSPPPLSSSPVPPPPPRFSVATASSSRRQMKSSKSPVGPLLQQSSAAPVVEQLENEKESESAPPMSDDDEGELDSSSEEMAVMTAPSGRGGLRKKSEKKEDFEAPGAAPSGDALQTLIVLQTFEGFWEWNVALCKTLGIDGKQVEKLASKAKKNVLGTVLAVYFLETKLAHEKDSWELIVEKAKAWLDNEVGSEEWKELYKVAKQVIV
jgi:hypothetical protein